MNGIEKLRKLAIDMRFSEQTKDVKKQVISYSRSDRYPSMSTFSFIMSLADQISIEHNEELAEKTATICRKNAEIAHLRADLAAAKRDMSDEARETVERLRDIDCDCPAYVFRIRMFEVMGLDNARAVAENNDRLRDRLIELIEHGGKQYVDVVGLQGLSDKIDACASYLGHGGCADLACNMSDAAEDMFGIDEEANMADARVMLETIAERIRKAIDGAPIRGCPYYRQADHYCDAASALAHERVAAALWVEDQGGLDVVRDYPKMDEFVAKLAIDLGVSNDIGCGDDLREAISEELDKRLMPQGMEWPRFEDGERVPLDHVVSPMWAVSDDDTRSESWWCTGIEMRKRGEVVIHASDGDYDVATISLKRGERVKRTYPKVLGEDGLPIKVGETVYSLQGEGPLIVSGYDGEFLKIESGGLLRTDYATHTPPETQARINSDAKLKPVPYVRDVLKRENWDRVTERQAYLFMVADLLHRQRELDAKTMGGAR